MSNKTATTVEPATVIFDGKCGFCGARIKEMKERDSEHQLQFVPRQGPDTEARFPQIKSLELAEGILLIDTHGKVYVAADAIYQIWLRQPSSRWFRWLYQVPVLKQIIQLVYKIIAANRHHLGGGGGSCEL